jgi:hypothetical protein
MQMKRTRMHWLAFCKSLFLAVSCWLMAARIRVYPIGVSDVPKLKYKTVDALNPRAVDYDALARGAQNL